MGGNTAAINRTTNQVIAYANHIDFNKFNRSQFIVDFNDLFNELNNLFYKFNNKKIWDSNLLSTNIYFSGSASHLFSATLSDDEFIKYKPIVGDIDILIPRDYLKPLYHLLSTLESLYITPNIKYLGQNKRNQMGFQINALFKYTQNNHLVNVQIDFEGAPFENIRPTEYSLFSHNSSWNDIKLGLKGVAHKYLLQNIVRAKSGDSNIIIVTPASTVEKYRIKKLTDTPRLFAFSVDRGLRQKYRPLKDGMNHFKINDKLAYIEIPTNESDYIQDINQIYKYMFGTMSDNTNIFSFIGLVDSMKKYLPEQYIIQTFHYLLQSSLWGEACQQLDRTDKNIDYNIKMKIARYLINMFPYLAPIFKDFEVTIRKYYANYGSNKNSN